MIASTFVTALLAVAASARSMNLKKRDDTCLTYDQAYKVASTWGGLIANYTKEVADLALVEDFTDYSESVNSLINNCPQGEAAIALPLLDPTFTNRTAFERGQGEQPPINFILLEVFPGCGAVSFRWKTTNTAPIPNPRPIVGNIIIKTQKNPDTTSEYEFLINTVYSEFDSGDWLANLKDAGICNITAPACTSSASSSSSVAAPVTLSPTPAPTPASYPGAGGNTITASPTITAGPSFETSTSTDADGNVWVIVTEIDDVYVTDYDYVTVTAY
jgi:hypothetical protein